MRKTSLFFFIALFLIVCCTPFIRSQETVIEVIDTVFVEIILDNNGVTAVDTLGNHWYYDFQEETFVIGDTPEEMEGGTERGLTSNDLPIEERCTEPRRVKNFSSSVIIKEDEYVDSDIIINGQVVVKGWVKGDVTSLYDRVLVTQSGQVDGDISAPEIIIKEGAVVLGEQFIKEAPLDIDNLTLRLTSSGVIVVLSVTIFLVILGLIIGVLFPEKQKTIDETISNYRLKTYFFGLLIIIFLPVLLVITIVGMILVIFLPFLYIIALAMGLNNFANAIGEKTCKLIFKSNKNHYLQKLIGYLFITLLLFFTTLLLTINAQPWYGFGILLMTISILIMSYPMGSGIGAAALSRFGFKKYTSWKEKKSLESTETIPAPPPIPKSPENMANNFSHNSNIRENRGFSNYSDRKPINIPPDNPDSFDDND